MRAFLCVSLSPLLSLTLLRSAQAEIVPPPDPEPATPATQQHVQKLLTGLPLSFIPNQGQADKQIKYSLQGRDAQVYFTAKGLTMVLTEPGKQKGLRREASLKAMPQAPDARSRWVTKLDFVDARRDIQLEGVERGEGVVSYFKGNEDQWETGLPTYHKLVYREVWPGIDVEYSGTGQKLKTTFIVKPGADPKRIRLAYRGVTKLALAENGQLNIHTPKQILTEDTPYSYQEINGKQEEVRSTYRLRRHGSRSVRGFEYGFEVGKYDRRQTLIIDPVLVVYAGYIGGNANLINFVQGDDYGRGIAVDNAGNAYVTGYTRSDESTFPDVVGPDRTYNGNFDAFVAKVRADGTGLIYAGYIGGRNDDFGRGIAVDSAGNAYVAGDTNTNHLPAQGQFPVRIGPDLVYNGGNDAFIAKVKADGLSLVYAGYIGENSIDQGYGVAVDAAGNAYVTGSTESTQTTFPDGDGFGTLPGPDRTFNGPFADAFVAKVRADGTSLAYAGYIGGTDQEAGHGIAVDTAGNAYVTGSTSSTESTFPDGDGFGVLPGVDRTFNGIVDIFVVKVKADGTVLLWATYVGGNSYDGIRTLPGGIAVDGTGNVYVTGQTSSRETTFPDGDGFGTLPGADRTFNGADDAFIVKVRADGLVFLYATYIGGTKDDHGSGIAVDRVGNAYVGGWTASNHLQTLPTDGKFPVKLGPDLIFNGGLFDAFVAKVNPTGTVLVYAGYIGGSASQFGGDQGRGIAVDGVGNAYIVGETSSTQLTFPEKTGPDLSYNGGTSDAFVAKIGGLSTGIGIYRPSTGWWYLDINHDGRLNVCTIDKCQGPFGLSTDIPVVGRWNGVATPRIGTFTPSTRAWRLDLNGNGVWNEVPTDRQVVFGIVGDKPVVGDWTGTGITRVGVFRQSTGMWYLDKDNDGLLEACTIDICQGPFGINGDRPVVGNWSGNGKTKIGIYRASANRWIIDYNGDVKWSGTPTDKVWAFGLATDQQIVGDWTGDGKSKLGLFRASTGIWYLDADGNGAWNTGDLIRRPFGLATDKAVAGAW